MSKCRTGGGIKFISLLLIVGGVAGVLAGVWADVQTLQQTGLRPSFCLISIALIILLFGWSVWVGVLLWKSRPEGYKWAKVLFAAQIPFFTLPGFSFSGFYTGMTIYLALSRAAPNLRFGFQLQSALHFLISEKVNNVLFGVNFVAIFALAHLFYVTSSSYGRKPDDFGLIGDT